MGASNSVYIGVYLEIASNKGTRIEKSYNTKSGNKTKTKFNPETGEPNIIVEKSIQFNDYPDQYELCIDNGLDEDEFFSPEYEGSGKGNTTWLPNNGEFREDVDSDYVFNCDLEGVDMSVAKNKFVNKYKIFLNKLGDSYKFKVKYGVVYYAH